MVLTVEIGNGDANADSYQTVQGVTDYLTKFQDPLLATWTALAIDAQEAACRDGTRWIDSNFESLMQGTKVNSIQALAFGRLSVIDYSGYQYPNTPLPQVLLDVTSIIASKSANGEVLTPDLGVGSGSLSRKTSKVGDLLITRVYSGTSGGSSQTKTYTLALQLLREVLFHGGPKVVRA